MRREASGLLVKMGYSSRNSNLPPNEGVGDALDGFLHSFYLYIAYLGAKDQTGSTIQG